MPWRRPTSSMSPTAAATPERGSCSSPKVRARKKNSSESVAPSISGKSEGSTAMANSRFTAGKSQMSPLCIHSQLPWRNGWQLVCWTAEPVEARMCAKTRRADAWADSSRRLRSFQTGSVLWYTPGFGADPYQPTPKPSPLVVSTPSACVFALHHKRVGGFVQKLFEPHWRTRIRQPTAHGVLPLVWTAVHHGSRGRTSSPGGDSRRGMRSGSHPAAKRPPRVPADQGVPDPESSAPRITPGG